MYKKFSQKIFFIFLLNILNTSNIYSSDKNNENKKGFLHFFKNPKDIFFKTEEEKGLEEKRKALFFKIEQFTNKNEQDPVKIEELTFKKKNSNPINISNNIIKFEACFDNKNDENDLKRNQKELNLIPNENEIDLEKAINEFDLKNNQKKMLDLDEFCKNVAELGIINNNQEEIEKLKSKIRSAIHIILTAVTFGGTIYSISK